MVKLWLLGEWQMMNGFEFRQFSSHLKIQLVQENGKVKPLMLDCIQWLPAKMNLTALSQMEGFSHQGSLVYINLQKNILQKLSR